MRQRHYFSIESLRLFTDNQYRDSFFKLFDRNATLYEAWLFST